MKIKHVIFGLLIVLFSFMFINNVAAVEWEYKGVDTSVCKNNNGLTGSMHGAGSCKLPDNQSPKDANAFCPYTGYSVYMEPRSSYIEYGCRKEASKASDKSGSASAQSSDNATKGAATTSESSEGTKGQSVNNSAKGKTTTEAQSGSTPNGTKSNEYDYYDVIGCTTTSTSNIRKESTLVNDGSPTFFI